MFRKIFCVFLVLLILLIPCFSFADIDSDIPVVNSFFKRVNRYSVDMTSYANRMRLFNLNAILNDCVELCLSDYSLDPFLKAPSSFFATARMNANNINAYVYVAADDLTCYFDIHNYSLSSANIFLDSYCNLVLNSSDIVMYSFIIDDINYDKEALSFSRSSNVVESLNYSLINHVGNNSNLTCYYKDYDMFLKSSISSEPISYTTGGSLCVGEPSYNNVKALCGNSFFSKFNSSIGAVVPIGIGIMAMLIGVGLIPRILNKFI